MVDGTASRDYASIDPPVCSPAGSHVAADRIGAVVRTGAEVSWYVVRPGP